MLILFFALKLVIVTTHRKFEIFNKEKNLIIPILSSSLSSHRTGIDDIRTPTDSLIDNNKNKNKNNYSGNKESILNINGNKNGEIVINNNNKPNNKPNNNKSNLVLGGIKKNKDSIKIKRNPLSEDLQSNNNKKNFSILNSNENVIKSIHESPAPDLPPGIPITPFSHLSVAPLYGSVQGKCDGMRTSDTSLIPIDTMIFQSIETCAQHFLEKHHSLYQLINGDGDRLTRPSLVHFNPKNSDLDNSNSGINTPSSEFVSFNIITRECYSFDDCPCFTSGKCIEEELGENLKDSKTKEKSSNWITGSISKLLISDNQKSGIKTIRDNRPEPTKFSGNVPDGFPALRSIAKVDRVLGMPIISSESLGGILINARGMDGVAAIKLGTTCDLSFKNIWKGPESEDWIFLEGCEMEKVRRRLRLQTLFIFLGIVFLGIPLTWITVMFSPKLGKIMRIEYEKRAQIKTKAKSSKLV